VSRQPCSVYYQADLSTHGPWHNMCGRVNARLTWIRPSAGSFWLNQPIPGSHVPSTDLPESSDLGLSFSEPLAEQAKELWTLSGALHGHHLKRFTRGTVLHCSPHHWPTFSGTRELGPQWALRLPPSTGASFWGSP
jgi:hypothetical protein